jgi:hypothetical protein
VRGPKRPRSWSCWALLAAALASAACGSAAHDAAPQLASGECVRCHMPEYLEAEKPVHVGVRPTACAVCHVQDSWTPSVFKHPWPLSGAHENARCAACHVGQPPVYAGTSKLCVSCHRDDYERSDYPDHATFATTCADCHSTVAWTPARKPHVEDASALDAAATRDQHSPSKSRSPSSPRAPHTPSTASRPTNARAPSAAEAPAASRQGSAREATTDEPAVANELVAPASEPARVLASPVHPENRFPIASGAHEGIRCRTCHDQGGAMGKDNTDCVQCHARAKFDRIHDGVRAYPDGVAPPNFCLRCHASGRVRGR